MAYGTLISVISNSSTTSNENSHASIPPNSNTSKYLLRQQMDLFKIFVEVIDENRYLAKLKKYAEEGGDIESTINEANFNNERCGTILHSTTRMGYCKVVKYILDKGADISKMIFLPKRDRKFLGSFFNALEFAILTEELYSKEDRYRRIFEMIRDKSLEAYSSFGLLEVHIACARGSLPEIKNLLNPTNINKIISEKSPIWAGMSPLLLAAKFLREDVMSLLLDLGASPKIRDSRGFTALHYLCRLELKRFRSFDTRKLFIHDEESTFGGKLGVSHFHIACLNFPYTHHKVKKYLDQGTSPNLQLEGEDTLRDTPLHLTAKEFVRKPCHKLLRILLEYGADVDRKNELRETTLRCCLDRIHTFGNDLKCISNYVCLLLEMGADSDYELMKKFRKKIEANESAKLIFLRCIKRMSLANKELVTPALRRLYSDFLLTTPKFDEKSYEDECAKELEKLSKVGLSVKLNQNGAVWSDFRKKFGFICDIPHSWMPFMYPIYGQVLKIKIKRELLEFEKKRTKVPQAVPYITDLVSKFCCPNVCARTILWYFSAQELNEFIKFSVKKRVLKLLLNMLIPYSDTI